MRVNTLVLTVYYVLNYHTTYSVHNIMNLGEKEILFPLIHFYGDEEPFILTLCFEH